MEKEPQDQYNMLVFEKISWGEGTERINTNTDRSIRTRRHTYTLLDTIDDNELKEFSDMILRTEGGLFIFGVYNSLGGTLDIVSDYFYPKRDTLNKLDISNLEKIKESFEKILSTVKFVSEASKQLLLDYRNDKDLIKTDKNKLESHVDALRKQMLEKALEVEKLRDITRSIII
ncbi:virulence associated lipoprotein [Borreliella valaisiana]|uniref:virulence associated lipoprotein n=1 Tax=Borreliella valaisiana TaxID=62088 RepID=UPI003B21366F